MGMSTHVVGFKPPDEGFKAKLEAYRALVRANIAIPDELSKFFGDEEPDPNGVEVKIETRDWSRDGAGGYEIDLDNLDPSIKIIRFYNSW